MKTLINLVKNIGVKSLKYVAGAVLLCGLPAHAQNNTNFWYHYEELLSISNRLYFDSYPAHITFLSVFGLGNCALLPVSWPLQDFTGFPVNNATNQQRAHGYGYGEMGFQVGGSGMGYWINTDSATAFNNYIGARNYYISTRADNKRPWSSQFGSQPVLQIESKWYLQRCGISGTFGAFFGQMGVSILDTKHNKGVFYTVTLWDNRGSSQYYEYVHQDTGGTDNAIVTTLLAGGTQYCTRQASSEATGSTGGYFCARISASQLIHAIEACNAKLGSGLSTDPNDYVLCDFWSGCEGYRTDSTTRIQAGYRTYALNAYTVY